MTRIMRTAKRRTPNGPWELMFRAVWADTGEQVEGTVESHEYHRVKLFVDAENAKAGRA